MNVIIIIIIIFTEVTLSALNAPEGDVDIEGLGDSSASKKLDFDSGETERQKHLLVLVLF